MSQQQALLVTELGKPVTLSSSWPVPKPEPTQMLIRVTVTALNPHDQRARDWGLFIKDSLPAPLGSDYSGVVEAIGSEVKNFSVGDRVFTYGNMLAPGHVQNGLMQYAVADESYSAKIPDGFTDHDVVTLSVNIIASVIGLFQEGTGLGLPAPWTAEAKSFDYANTVLLIIGGGSNCGRFAVQLAKIAGVGKIVVLGGKEDELKKFGATDVLDRHGGDEVVQSRIKAAVGDDLIYAFDCVNLPPTIYVGINALSKTRKGTVARLIPTSPYETAKVEKKEGEYVVKDTFGLAQFQSTGKGFYENVVEYLKDGKAIPLKYEVAEGVGLNAEKVNEVLDRYRDGKPVVQTHFRISE